MRTIFIFITTLILVILFVPALLVFALYFFAALPEELPFGISEQPQLVRNFQAHRTELEDIITTARALNLTTAQGGYWGLTGYKMSEPQGADYEQLYRLMKKARIQQLHLQSDDPFSLELVTDERVAMIDINRYGYVYIEDPMDADHIPYSDQKLSTHWVLFEEIP